MSNRLKAVIDRIVDGKQAVLHVGDRETEWILPVNELPAGAKEGIWLRVGVDGNRLVDIEIDEQETGQRAAGISEKMRMLRERGRRRE